MTKEDVDLFYMPLWVKEMATDEDCMSMTNAEYGLFHRMLVRQWIEGSIPQNRGVLSGLTHSSEEEVARWFTRFPKKFQVVDAKVTRKRLINARLHALREEAIAKVLKNRRNGQKGGRPSKNPRGNPLVKRPVKPIKTHAKPNAPPISELESESESEGMGSSASASSRGRESRDYTDSRLGHIEPADLTDPERLAQLEARIMAAGLVKGDEDRVRLFVWSAARRATTIAEEPPRFFAAMILGGTRAARITQADEEAARQAIIAHYRGITQRPKASHEEQTA